MNHFVILHIFGRFGWSWHNLNAGHFDVAKTSIFLMVKCCQMLAKIDCKKSAKNCFVRNTARSCHNVSILQLSQENISHDDFTKIIFQSGNDCFEKGCVTLRTKSPALLTLTWLWLKLPDNFFCQKNDTFDCYWKVLISLTKYFLKIP